MPSKAEKEDINIVDWLIFRGQDGSYDALRLCVRASTPGVLGKYERVPTIRRLLSHIVLHKRDDSDPRRQQAVSEPREESCEEQFSRLWVLPVYAVTFRVNMVGLT